MDIKPSDKTIRDLLGSKRQFVIPRFQREYSWEKKNYREFFEDMLLNLEIKEGKIIPSQYFLGTMLFIGNFTEGTEQIIQVVDGQQRLTTITILFSAMSDRFIELGQDKLSSQVFSYIMTEDDNGDEVRILKSKTSYPFFSFYIQDRKKEIHPKANSEEEKVIQEAYNYFKSELNIESLHEKLKKQHGSDVVSTLDEIEILKALRDQVLNTTFVSISTTTREQANRIFEILNAKGKQLASIDLIKNRLFEVLHKQEPADYAEEKWKEIKALLNSGRESIGFATFYRHYWISKYKLIYSKALYEGFKKIPKNETSYKAFLEDLSQNARIYKMIVEPCKEDYDNRKEYYWLVQSLDVLNNYFNVVQVRIALLALFDIKKKGIIDSKLFKETILYLEKFHFVYTALLSGRTNRMEKIYSTFAIEVRCATNKTETREIIKKRLIEPLELLIPVYDDFERRFIMLNYSKSESVNNMKTKYIVRKLNCYYSNEELFDNNGSVEHIIPETKGETALNIGNLILLEQNLNTSADQKEYSEKRSIYLQSRYDWIHHFCEEHAEWDQSMIESRAKEMAKVFYEKILSKTIENR